jgi:uncharacterized protein YjiS (DUF1127 family)
MIYITNIRLLNQSQFTISFSPQQRSARKAAASLRGRRLEGVETMSTVCTHYRAGEAHPRAQDAQAASRFLAKVRSAIFWPHRVLQARRELEMLARMTEYELKDIGLTRTDLGDATALPADASPSEFLAARVEERFGRKAA